MKRHRPNKSNPVPRLRAGETLKAKNDYAFVVEGDKSGRTYWLHPTKGWRSQGRR